jgi:hypothetical protein
MQYSGSSYVWNLLQSFRSVTRARRSEPILDTCFAHTDHLETEASDAAIRFGYRPLFMWIAKTCERLWPLQHGRIQLYLVYVVVTIVIAFAVEFGFHPFSRGSVADDGTRQPVAHRTSATAHGGDGTR